MQHWWLLHFHSGDQVAKRKLMEFLERVHAFVRKEDSAADPELLVTSVLYSYWHEDQPLVGLGIMRDSEMVGHVLVQRDDYYGTKNATIIQYELDVSPTRAAHKKLFEELCTIGRALGAHNLVGICPDERIAKVHRIFHGMTRYATIMSLDLTSGAKGADDEHGKGRREDHS